MDFEKYLPDNILVKVDRASMLNSLEVRSPFLDRHVIEYAYAKVASHLKATGSGRKLLLRQLARRVLPEGFDSTRKQGFSIPIYDWLRTGAFWDLFWGILESPDCSFDSKMVSRLLCGFDRGQCNGERLFGLAMFELWRKEYDAVL